MGHSAAARTNVLTLLLNAPRTHKQEHDKLVLGPLVLVVAVGTTSGAHAITRTEKYPTAYSR
jgi:hypothetical protein